MKTLNEAIGAFEAKNRFSELLDRVGHGAEIIVTKHNRPAAMIVPVRSRTSATRRSAAQELRALSAKYALKGTSVRDLISKGRA